MYVCFVSGPFRPDRHKDHRRHHKSKSARVSVPSVRVDLSMTEMCGSMPRSYKPPKHLACLPIGRIRNQASGHDAENRRGLGQSSSASHPVTRTASLHINDDGIIRINQVIVGICEERRAVVGGRPLDGGSECEVNFVDLRRSTKRLVIQGLEQYSS